METSKAVELLEKSSHIGIIIPPEPDIDHLSSAEVFSAFLTRQGKKVGFLNKFSSSLPPRAIPSVSSANLLPKEFVVSLNTSGAPISQLRYEKHEDRVDVIFSPKFAAISSDAVSFRQGKMLCDLVVTLGVPDIESLNGSIGSGPEFISETPTINIDASEENKKYGEANLVAEEKSSLSEVVYHFVANVMREPIEKEHANLLFASIIHKTDTFRSHKTGAETLLAASELLRVGASREEAMEMLKETKSASLAQLCGRASVRSRFDDSRNILWSFLTPEDFEKTGRNSKDAAVVISHLEKEFPPYRASALIWQEKDHPVRAMLGGQKDRLSLIAAEHGRFQSPHLLLHRTFDSFKEAEEYIQSLLGKVL